MLLWCFMLAFSFLKQIRVVLTRFGVAAILIVVSNVCCCCPSELDKAQCRTSAAVPSLYVNIIIIMSVFPERLSM